MHAFIAAVFYLGVSHLAAPLSLLLFSKKNPQNSCLLQIWEDARLGPNTVSTWLLWVPVSSWEAESRGCMWTCPWWWSRLSGLRPSGGTSVVMSLSHTASPFSLLMVVKSCQSTVSNSSLLWNQKWVREYFDYSQLVLARWNFTASAKCLKDKTRNFLYWWEKCFACIETTKLRICFQSFHSAEMMNEVKTIFIPADDTRTCLLRRDKDLVIEDCCLRWRHVAVLLVKWDQLMSTANISCDGLRRWQQAITSERAWQRREWQGGENLRLRSLKLHLLHVKCFNAQSVCQSVPFTSCDLKFHMLEYTCKISGS